MKIQPLHTKKTYTYQRGSFADKVWNEGFIYLKTVVDTMVHPFLLLDKNLTVIGANEVFYKSFIEKRSSTEKVNLEKLSLGSWNNPELLKRVRLIFSDGGFIKGFELSRVFPKIGKRVLVLSARQVFYEKEGKKLPHSMVVLAIEDATELLQIAELIIKYPKQTAP